MSRTEVWTQAVPEPAIAESFAQRAEAAGWDGVVVVDSQNLTGDPYVGLAMMGRATERIGLATGVTNPVTRHPAATASAIASVQEYSGGRAVLGIGRGDSALFQVGQEPAPVAVFERYLRQLAGYLRGEEVDLDGKPSRLHWLGRAAQPKVPLDVAATGPKVIAAAARHADRITFAVGADPERIRWGIEVARQARTEAGLDPEGMAFGAYVNVVPHPDAATAVELSRGTVATIAHFSGMAGSTGEGQRPEDREVFERLHASYDRPHHTMGRARHAAVIDEEFAQRFAILGDPDRCLERLRKLRDAGASRFVIIGPSIDSDPDERRRSNQLMVGEVLPDLQAG
ncbi:MAG TPA: LLM class flavin-dependent oxidoreductase [Acidimicrobiia bacterium]|nr:LLM class flavin-dependent oxidoreductase [Acidimicrobiia bacterium]